MVKLLEQIYRTFTWISICPPDPSASKWIRFRNNTTAISIFVVLCTSVISSFIFILENSGTDLASSFCAGFQIGGTTAPAFTLAAAYVLRDDVINIFIEIQKIHDMNEERSKFILEANQFSEWLITLFMKYFTMISTLTVFMMCTGSVIYSILQHGYIEPDILFHPFRLVCPWNQNTVLGWMAETVFSLCICLAHLFTNPVFLFFFVAICGQNHAYSQTFRSRMDEIHEMARIRRYEVRKYLFQSIEFHVTAKRLFNLTAHIYSTFILVQLLSTMVHLACSIFAMELALRNISIEVFEMIIVLLLSASNLFLYCYFGKVTTESFAAYADHLYNSNWIVLPIDLQKSFVVMIAHAQKPLSYHGYNIVDLNLETFTKMFKTVITYYLMFKTMTSEA